jgi:hypothetical protein
VDFNLTEDLTAADDAQLDPERVLDRERACD